MTLVDLAMTRSMQRRLKALVPPIVPTAGVDGAQVTELASKFSHQERSFCSRSVRRGGSTILTDSVGPIPVITRSQRSRIQAPRASRLVSTRPPPPLLGVSPAVAASDAPLVPYVPIVAPSAPLSPSVGVLAGCAGPEIDSNLNPVAWGSCCDCFYRLEYVDC